VSTQRVKPRRDPIYELVGENISRIAVVSFGPHVASSL
jgi:hypothetical protein